MAGWYNDRAMTLVQESTLKPLQIGPITIGTPLVLAPMAGLADRMELINSQRRHYFGIMRNLMDMQASMDRATPAARLLIEGAVLHLQADLDWLERCQEELV